MEEIRAAQNAAYEDDDDEVIPPAGRIGRHMRPPRVPIQPPTLPPAIAALDDPPIAGGPTWKESWREKWNSLSESTPVLSLCLWCLLDCICSDG